MQGRVRGPIVFLVSALLVLGIGITASPAQASTVAPTSTYGNAVSFLNGDNSYYNTCGRYWPSEGVFETYGSGTVYEAALHFKVTSAEKNALNNCVRNTFQENTLEIDFTLHGLYTPGWWDNYSIHTNLPGAVHDTAAFDSANHSSPGVTNIRTNDLQVGSDYVVVIAWSDSDVVPIPGDVPRVSVEWVPSHTARGNELYCLPALITLNPAYCIFGTAGRVYLSGGYYNGPHPVGGDGLPFDNNRAYAFPPVSGAPVSGDGGVLTAPGLAAPFPVVPVPNPLVDGNFVSYHGAVYRIAGGAPLYVSGQDAGHPDLAGWAHATVVNDAQWASLRPIPADGMYLSDVQTGAVYVTVGGAPMYVSGEDAPFLPNWVNALRVPHWDFVNYQHLRPYPVDGYYLSDVQTGAVFVTAGGAPLYISGDDAPSLPQWGYATPAPHWEFVNNQHLRSIPADGTYISDVQTGMVHITLGGAPMYISGDDAPYLPNWAGANRVPHWDFQHWSHLRPFPADGYYLRDVQTNAVYVTAGGAPLYVTAEHTAWLPQWQYASPVSHWELQNRTHLRQLPVDGTYVRGVPSGEVFQMVSGVAVRVVTNPLPAATNVDDWAVVNQLGGTL